MYSIKKQLLFYFILTQCIYSQNNNLPDSIKIFDKISNKNLYIVQNESIKTLTTTYNYLKDKKIMAFKIQLNSLNDSRTIAKSDSIKYEKIFYPEKIKIVYETPYFKTQTTCFLRKIDAEKKLKKIEKHFRNAFIFKERVDISELQKNAF